MRRKRTPWPRWAKLTRNLLIFFLLALTVWAQLGRPLPYEAALRRTARQYLMPEMDHHAEISRGYWGGTFRAEWTEGAAMVSVPTRPLHAEFFYYPVTEPFRLTEGTNLLAFPWTVLLPGSESGLPESYAVYTALFPPEGSASAVLTLHNNSGTFTVAGRREDEIFIFYARPEPEEDGSRRMDSSWFFLGEFTYELTFYNEAGEIVNL